MFSTERRSAAREKVNVLSRCAATMDLPGYTRLIELERQLRWWKCRDGGRAPLEVVFRRRDRIDEFMNSGTPVRWGREGDLVPALGFAGKPIVDRHGHLLAIKIDLERAIDRFADEGELYDARERGGCPCSPDGAGNAAIRLSLTTPKWRDDTAPRCRFPSGVSGSSVPVVGASIQMWW
jgi:hypothetical protein